MREGVPIGVFNLARVTVRPFTEKQVELVPTDASKTSLQAWLTTSLASAELTMGERLL